MADPTSNKITKVQLTLYATKLKNVAGAFNGKSDPYAVVTLLSADPNGEQPRILGQTEVIKNNLSPIWIKKFDVDFMLGKPPRVNVGIYDEVKKAKHNKPMGSAVFDIGEVLGARGNIKAKKLKGGGTIFIRAEKAAELYAGTFEFTLRGVKLKNVDGMFGKSDPFFEVSKHVQAAGGPTWQVVYRSKPIQNDLNPKWESVTLDMNELCDGNQSKPVLVSVLDWEKNGKHGPMGFFETSVAGLIQAKNPGGSGDIKTIDTTKAFKLTRRGKFFGHVVVTAAVVTGASPVTFTESHAASMATPITNSVSYQSTTVGGPTNLPPFSMALDNPPPSTTQLNAVGFGTAGGVAIAATAAAGASHVPNSRLPLPIPPPGNRPNFIDYLTGGLELQLTVAIDFTGSNGDPRRPGTLHYIHPDGQLNDYEKALTAVGSIIARYDHDQKFPVLGFGAKYGGVINHCFQIGPTAEAQGIAGILQAYRSVFKSGLTMSGPTDFSEVIAMAAAQAQSKQDAMERFGQQAYNVLLILTDGAVTDVNATKHAIQAASIAPLSIVIVGIGNADFTAMQFLDDFQTPGLVLGRDIVQFVEFGRHRNNKISLTQATLDEIPDQLVDYFYGRGIMPLPEIRGSRMQLLADDFDADEDIDLNVEFNEDGEINLASGGYYDGTSYGNYSTYAGVTVMAPPSTASIGSAYIPSAPPSENPEAHASHQAYVPPSGTQAYNPHAQAYPAPVQQLYDPRAYTSNVSTSQYAQQPYASNVYAPQPDYQAHHHGQPFGGAPVMASVVVPPPQVFLVQLPAGVVAGQQLQIQSPTTGQIMIIAVPEGVPPGGTFQVQG